MNLHRYRKIISMLACLSLPLASPSYANSVANFTAKASAAPAASATLSYSQDASRIKKHFETQLFTLKPYTFAHYGVRMYRQYQDPKYALSLWVDAARVADQLNKMANQIHTPEQIRTYSLNKINDLNKKQDERGLRRFNATQAHPDFMYLGLELLSSLARANEFGLQHQQDAQLKAILRRYDFTAFVTDPEMIKAWAAQLANHVYWLRQLGEQDVVKPFIDAFRSTYPDAQDHLLNEQQFSNKVYGLTHIVFADSQYYLTPIKESDHQWIFDYFRKNIDTILMRCKEDVIAEVGINFLLAELDNDPVVHKTRAAISKAVDRKHNMVLSVTGDAELERGEHRNVLAIMLLDWQGFSTAAQPALLEIIANPPYGLVAKKSKNKPASIAPAG